MTALPSSRLVDPVHFFDSLGNSVLSNTHLEQELQRLEEENEELKTKVARLTNRLRILGEDL